MTNDGPARHPSLDDAAGSDEQSDPAVRTDSGVNADPVADSPRPRRRLRVWQESVLLVGAAIVLAIIVKALFVQAFYIPSASMEPGLVKDDRILVQKVSYWFGGSPSRGDVVVFEDPGGWLGANEQVDLGPAETLLSKIGLYPTGGHLVKRVIGVAGDTVTCCDPEGRISVNGHPLEEDDYILERAENIQCNGPMTGTCNWTAGPVPEGTIFVMGDNRADSADSSYHLCDPDGETDCTDTPFIDDDLVVGKVFGVVWPRDHIEFVGRPGSFDDIPGPDSAQD